MFPDLLDKYMVVVKSFHKDGTVELSYGGIPASKKIARAWAADNNEFAFEYDDPSVTVAMRIGDIPIGDITDYFFGFDEDDPK